MRKSDINFNELKKQIKQCKQTLQETINEVEKIAEDTTQFLRGRLPVKSGELRDSIALKKKNTRGGREYAIVSPKANIVRYLSFGTRQHFVLPIFKKALHWIDPVTGEDCFSSGHKVRGIRARGMLKATAFYLETRMRRLIKQQTQKINKIFKR